MDYDKIINLDGWGKLSVSNLQKSIENSRNVSLQRFIYSLGIRHIGIENAKLIADNLKDIDSFMDKVNSQKFENFLTIDGIGETQIKSLKTFFSSKLNVNIAIELSSILNIQTLKINKNGVLKDKSFMFTGKLDGISRAEAKSLIEKNSGTTISSISKNLDYLVVGNKPTKRKVEQAKDYGVKIVSLKELKDLLN